MNSAKDVLSKHEVFSKMLDNDYNRSDFTKKCLKEIPMIELSEAISFLKGALSQLDTISENMIIKNMGTIIRDGKRIENKKTSELEKINKVALEG